MDSAKEGHRLDVMGYVGGERLRVLWRKSAWVIILAFLRDFSEIWFLWPNE